jgi:hypothetical protein
MLDLALIPYLKPKRGNLLVERIAMPERFGVLWLPEGYRGSTRSAYARVLYGGTSEFRHGELVMLGVNVNKGVAFGYGEDERVIWICTPADILYHVHEVAEDAELPQRSDTHPFEGITPDILDRANQPDLKFDEADPRARR